MEHAENQNIHTTKTLNNAKDVILMAYSKTVLGPRIEKIIVTDKDDLTQEPIEIKEESDANTILKAYETIAKITDKGHRSKAEIHYDGTVFRIGFPNDPYNSTRNHSL
jgi:hypothetical protein